MRFFSTQALFSSYKRNAADGEKGLTKEKFINLMKLHGIVDDTFLDSETSQHSAYPPPYSSFKFVVTP